MKTSKCYFIACAFALGALVPCLHADPKDPSVPGPAPAVAKDAAKGFRFLGGDPEQGKSAFVALQCTQCHRVAGADLPEPEGRRRLGLELGREARFVKGYEDLILAITNPKHVVEEQYRTLLVEDGVPGDVEPFMPNLAESMTAKQLIDLVTFLDKQYREHQSGYHSPE